MFIKLSTFKKMCSHAYKETGLSVGLTEKEVYIIASNWWTVAVPKENMYPKHLAAVVELTGQIPEKGEAYTYRKECSPQAVALCTLDMDMMDLWQKYESTYRFSRVYFKNAGKTDTCIMQNTSDPRDKFLISMFIYDLIDADTLDDGETYPDMKSQSNSSNIVVRTNRMDFSCMKRPCRYYGEKELMQSIIDVDLLWEFNAIKE